MRRPTWTLLVLSLSVTGITAGSTVCAIDPSRVTRSRIDPGTGLEVRLSETAGHYIVEVGTAAVSVKKDVGGGQSVTTVRTPQETVVLTVAGRQLTLDLGGRRVIITGVSPEAIGRAVALLRQSGAIRAARALLARTRLAPESFEGRALLLTQILLASVSNATASPVGLRAWSPVRPGAVLRVTNSADSCWDTYAKKADTLMQELGYCISHPSWWNPFPLETCEIEYAIKAETAFAEYAVCEGARIMG